MGGIVILCNITRYYSPLAPQHNQPTLGSRSAGRLAACQLAAVVYAHRDDGGNDGTAGQQVAEGSAFSVGHGESWCDLPPIVAHYRPAVNPGACLPP